MQRVSNPDYADRLRLIMAAKQLTITALSETIGRSRSTVSRWASGEFFPSIADIDQIIQYLDLPISSVDFQFLSIIDFGRKIGVRDDAISGTLSKLPSSLLDFSRDKKWEAQFTRDCLGIYDIWHAAYSKPETLCWEVARISGYTSNISYHSHGLHYAYSGSAIPVFSKTLAIISEENGVINEIQFTYCNVKFEIENELPVPVFTGVATGVTPYEENIGATSVYLRRRLKDHSEEAWKSVTESYNKIAGESSSVYNPLFSKAVADKEHAAHKAAKALSDKIGNQIKAIVINS